MSGRAGEDQPSVASEVNDETVQEPHQAQQQHHRQQSHESRDGRSASILGALDAVHRSLLLNNIKYECDITDSVDTTQKLRPCSDSHTQTPPSIQINVNVRKTAARDPHDATTATNMRNPAACREKTSRKTRSPQVGHGEPDSQQKTARRVVEEDVLQDDATNCSTTTTNNGSIDSTINSSFGSSSSQAYDQSTPLDESHAEEEANTSSLQGSQRRPPRIKKRSSAGDNPEKPMIRIVQEMSEKRAVVVSTIEVNREKMRHWQHQSTAEPRRKSAESKRRTNRSRQSRQRVISENFCNEFLDQKQQQDHEQPATVYTSSSDEEAERACHNNTTLPMAVTKPQQAPITFGKLQASPSTRNKPRAAGKLMAKRLARHSMESLQPLPQDGPPAKPPRTFSSSVSSASGASSANGRHPALASTTTLRADDGRRKTGGGKVVGWNCVGMTPEIQHADDEHQFGVAKEFLMHEQFECPQKSTAPPKRHSTIGWAPLQQDIPSVPQPTAWTPPPKSAVQQQQHSAHIPQQIVDMLYYDKQAATTPPHPKSVPMMTATQRAVPQSPPREYIDEVDFSPRAARAVPSANCSGASKHMDRFAADTVFSTPQRHNNTNHARLDHLRRAVERSETYSPPSVPLHPTAPALDEIESRAAIVAPPATCEHCHKCCVANKAPVQKKSFGKIALRRTKTFLEAGRHMLNRKSMHQPATDIRRDDSADDVEQRAHSDADVDRLELQLSPQKLETTVRKNRLNQSCSKRTEKSLDLEREVFSDGVVVESPRRMYERFLVTAAQQSGSKPGPTSHPPKKPARTMCTQNTTALPKYKQNDFDFQRKVASPKVGHRTVPPVTTSHSPSKTGALLLLPKRLFGGGSSKSQSKSGANLNIAPASPSYKSFEDADDGFAVFMSEYLRRMYEQIEVNRPQASKSTVAPTSAHDDDQQDFVQIRDDCSSECSNGEDVVPERSVGVQNLREPLYSEIQKKIQLSPVYAVVNKTTSAQPSSGTDKSSGGNLFSQSVDSLCMLNNTDDHDLVNSIEDFLGTQLLAGLRPKVSAEFKSMSGVMEAPPLRESKSANDLESIVTDARDIDVPMVVQAAQVQIKSPAKCKESHQRSCDPGSNRLTAVNPSNDEVEIYSDISSEPQMIYTAAVVHSAHTTSTDEGSDNDIDTNNRKDDTLSIGTYSSIVLTESICDEVLRGEQINDDICDTMNRLQSALNLTEHGCYAQAEPESSLDGLYLTDDALSDRQNSSAPVQRSQVPKYKQFADSVRNSIRSSSRFFKTSASTTGTLSSPTSSARRIDEIADYDVHADRKTDRAPNYMQVLHDQIAYQRDLRPQLLQAITICRSSAGFEGSAELVEAERLLLLSHAKETAARCEQTRINFNDQMPSGRNRRMTGAAALGSAMLEIRRLEFRLRRPEVFDMHYTFYYVCMCSYRNQVLATSAQIATTGDEDADDPDRRVVFEGLSMRFVDMQPNFQLKVEVFALRKPHYATLSMTAKEAPDASRFRPQDAAFATPANLWPMSSGARNGNATSLRTHCRRYEFPQCTTVSASSCIFSGSSAQRLVPFASAEPYTATAPRVGGSTTMLMSGRPLRVDFYSEILLDIPELKGFLYVRRADAAWSRQWCWIRGCKLFMSSAVKQSDAAKLIGIEAQPAPPTLHTIDLTHCVSDRLQLNPTPYADDVPYDFRHTVSIECLPSDGDKSPIGEQEASVEYVLASTAPGDLPVWVRELNRVLEFVHDWRL